MPQKDDSTSDLTKIFAYRVLIGTSIIIGLILLLLGLWYAVQVILIAFAGVLLAVLFRIPARWLADNSSLKDSWAVGVVLAVLVAILVGIGMLAAPQVSSQISQLEMRLPQAYQELQSWLQQYEWGQWLLNNAWPVEDWSRSIQQGFRDALGIASTLVQIVTGTFILLFVAIYLSLNPKLYVNGVLHMFPFSHRKRMAQVMGVLGYTLNRWLFGAFIHMTIVGVLTFVGLWLLDVPLAFLLAVLAFLLDFVPYLGPIFAAIPAVLIGFTQGPEQALYVALLYFAIQQFEGLLVDPLVYRKTLYLPPVVTVLSQILLYNMAGYLGMLLATPIVAVVFVLVRMLYIEQILGDSQTNAFKKGAESSGYIPQVPGKQRN